MDVSKTRHTFHYLDNCFSKERVATLDNFFRELDVATYMVEGKLLNLAARAGYHTLRAVAIGVQMCVYAIFEAFRYLKLGLYYAGCFLAKGATLVFADFPRCVRKRFFPTDADLHEKRVEDAHLALKEKRFSTSQILGPEDNKHKYLEQRDLMHTLLTDPVRN